MNYTEKELFDMFKTGTVTSYDKDVGRGVITDEKGEEYVILANNIVKTHTTQFLEKDDSVLFVPYYGDPSMQQAGMAKPLIGIDNNKPNDHKIYFILECYINDEKHEIERIKCLTAPTTDKIMFRDIFQAKSAYGFMQCPEQNFFVDTLSNILHLNLVNALSHMSKIPEDIIENNLHNIIEKFVVSAVGVKTNTVCWTITGSMTENGDLPYTVSECTDKRIIA